MTAPASDRPSARARWTFALALFALALTLNVLTLAPTVTLWDAGEFLAASKILGVPHPPGTPLWLVIAHTWGTLVGFGTWAWRLNLMTGVASAVATTCFGLVAWEALRRVPALVSEELPTWLVPVGAGAAAIAGGFTFTNWQNSNETEVYAIAMMGIGLTAWLLHRWRELRGAPQADRLLLVVLYIAGLAIGNHLLALLAGPAVVAFLWLVSQQHPLATPAARMRENATTAVVGGTWLLLIGLGLGSTGIAIIGGLCFLAAAIWAVTHGRGQFAFVALAVALIGITSYLIVYIRAGQHPMLNEAQPDNWDSLLRVIRREQYGTRTPFDDPTVLHGRGNPGRSLGLIGLQIVNYLQYFVWQWGMGMREWWGKAPFAALFTVLGALGLVAHKRSDRASWGFLFVLFLTTGIGLMGYMNFKPGFSLGYKWWPSFANHEVRERDYFFVVSFVVWGLWAGMGIVLLARRAWSKVASGLRPLAAGAVMALALIPVVTNWSAATRARPPIAQLPRDFAYDLLNSLPPYGVLITFGDNDTFPLWYAQEVEGIRPDVTILCLALAQTDWYIRQLRDNPTREFVDSAAAPIWRGHAGPKPDWPLHTMTDQEIATVAGVLTSVDRETAIQLGPITHLIPAGTTLGPNDFAVLRVIQQNLGRRPIAWSISTPRNFLGLDQYIVQQGMTLWLRPALADSTDSRYAPRDLAGVLFDVNATSRLVNEVYRWSGLDSLEGRERMDPAAEGVAGNLSQPVILLAATADSRGDLTTALRYLELADRISPNPQFRDAIKAIRQRQITGGARDSAPAP